MTEEEEKLHKIKKIQDAVSKFGYTVSNSSKLETLNFNVKEYQRLGYRLGYKLLDTHNNRSNNSD